MNKELIKKIDEFIHEDNGIVDITYNSIPLKGSPSIGFVSMEYINTFELTLVEELDNTPIKDMILYHELGHIYYKHNLYAIKSYNRITNFIKTNKDYIEESAKKLNIDENNLKKIFKSDFIFRLMNIAGDCQINSTILDKKDIDIIDKELVNLYPDADPESLSSVHPKKYNFLEGRDYMFYIVQILSKIEKFLNIVNIEEFGEGEGDGDSEGKQGENQKGSGTGEASEDGSGEQSQEKSKGGFFNREMLEELMETEKFDKKGEYQPNNEDEEDKPGGYGDLTETDEDGNEVQEGDTDKEEFGLEKGSGTGATLTRNTKNILKSIDDVFKDLKYTKENRSTHKRNIFKNQHRGRCKDVFIPTTRIEIKKVVVEKMIFLVDVSGSMHQDSIFGIVNEISKKVKELGLKSVRMITWNSDKVQDFELRNFESCKTSLYISGGTDLDRGIRFIRKENKEKYPIIVISDLGDNMQAWNKEFDQCDFPKYVITTGSIYSKQSLIDALNKDVKIFESAYA